MDDGPRLRDVQGGEPWMQEIDEIEGRGKLGWLVLAWVLGAAGWALLTVWVLSW